LLLLFSLAGFVGLLARPSLAAPPGARHFQGRGVYYVDGTQPCPLPGVGSRGAQACLRIALDDDATTAEVDPATHRIVLRNARRYEHKELIADVLALGWARSASGQRSPVAVHLLVRKHDDEFDAKAHAHAVVRDRPASIDLDDYTVVLADGPRDVVALTPAAAHQAIADPGLAARMASELVEVKDNIARDKPAAGKDPRIADVTVALGLSKAASDVARAQLVLTGGSRPASVPALLQTGDWELRIQSLSRLIPKDVIRRDLFLYGLEDLPLLDEVKKKGLAKGKTLTFALHNGQGTLTYNGASAPLPRAADSARAFLELSFLGAILEHQAELALH
jgi:hypothetical protein